MVKHKNTKKIPIILTSGLLIFGSGLGLWLANKDGSQPTANNGTSYSSPGQAEKKAANQNQAESTKHGQSNSTDNTPTTSSNKKQVSPVLSVRQNSPGANVEANGYVPGIVEEGGKCTLTLTRGTSRVSKSGTAFNDAQSTNCGLLVIARKSLSTGTWQAVLSYNSTESAGSSSPTSIEVK